MLNEKKIRIGILGGGQLGAMLIRSAIDFGLEISVLDTNSEAPAARYTNSFTCGDPNNYDDVVAFGKHCDIVTIEKEAVSTTALEHLRDNGVKVFPSPELIATIQDKQSQKEFLKLHDIATAAYVSIGSKEDLFRHSSLFPACLKLRRNGYDGKGVMMLDSESDVEIAFDEPSILEDKVKVKHELSVIVARGIDGSIEYYEPTLMVFDAEKHLLDFQICPAVIGGNLAEQAYEIAIKIATEMSLVGIMAIEMFVTEDNKLLVNELAPRPHNSGHHTIEACATSQYEQQIRAITGLPLGDTRLNCKAGLINIIETGNRHDLFKIVNIPNTHLHYYGKNNSRTGRKIGHITITEANAEDIVAKIAKIKSILN
jgi:5-(carboxyamino)imidazole ribonucleotide synthase